jgi:hypothetical protein
MSSGAIPGTGTRGQGLSHRTLNVVGDPRDACLFGILMEIVFREVMLPTQGRECLSSFLLVGARESACLAPFGIAAHLMQACLCFSKQSVIETSSDFRVRAYLALLTPIQPE